MRCVHEVVPYITKAAEQSLFYHISSLHQTGPRAHKLVNQYQIIVFEDLQVKNLTKAPAPKHDEKGKYVPNGAAAKAGLNKSILDAGWSTFTQMVSVKAACIASMMAMELHST